ncbi:MAG: hypothetical protein ACKN9U_02975, partial [Pirellulaceae bacterium]
MKTGEQWLEGKLKTFPEIGSSYFEPWRRDTVIGFQRLQSTLQTMRRTAKVQVVPNNAGYLVEVIVNKDIEEVDRSLSGADGPPPLDMMDPLSEPIRRSAGNPSLWTGSSKSGTTSWSSKSFERSKEDCWRSDHPLASIWIIPMLSTVSMQNIVRPRRCQAHSE